ncbi:hypothetical protein BROUX41_002960 [Berkeleyomyces rouxiae]|uniref:uncharacterized protein n=1 Tax=Berkeleyomyces rouxiae TaxID=2035830 RepID=UPI003B78DF5F
MPTWSRSKIPRKKRQSLGDIFFTSVKSKVMASTASTSKNDSLCKQEYGRSHNTKTSHSSKTILQTLEVDLSHVVPSSAKDIHSLATTFLPSHILDGGQKCPSLDPRLIHTAQSSSYWTGRFTAIHDQLVNQLIKNDDLAVYNIQGGSERLHGLHINAKRGRSNLRNRPEFISKKALLENKGTTIPKIAIAKIETLCTTDEAKASFSRWKLEYAKATGISVKVKGERKRSIFSRLVSGAQ